MGGCPYEHDGHAPTVARDFSDVSEEALAQGAGPEFRHVRTTYSRSDELCFSFFEAASEADVVAANATAGLAYERIVEVIDVSAVP